MDDSIDTIIETKNSTQKKTMKVKNYNQTDLQEEYVLTLPPCLEC